MPNRMPRRMPVRAARARGDLFDRSRVEMRTSDAEGVGHEVGSEFRFPRRGGEGACMRDAGFELFPNHRRYDHLCDRSGLLSHVPASGLDAESWKFLNGSVCKLATSDSLTSDLPHLFESSCRGSGSATKVEITGTGGDDGEEFSSPEFDPDTEPDAGLSDSACTKRMERPDASPCSGGFVAFGDPRDLLDAANVGISRLGGVTWMYTLLILILNLEKGETRGMVQSKRRRREGVGHEGRMGGWEWFS
jgi:hypothetical protein